MSTLNFPTSPSLNDTYSFGTKTWIWNGSAWQLNSAGAINNIPIGNVTASTGAFTTLTANSTISAVGNVTGGNIITTSVVSAATVTATGNISAAVALTANTLVITNTASVSGNLNMNSQNITSLANPVLAQDAATKTYVDTLVASGIHFHQPVRVESPINLVATYNNGTAGVGATLTNSGTQAALVIDGVTMIVDDRVLIYEQTNQTQNGIYVVTDIGSVSTNWILTRSSDADTYVFNSADGLSEGSSVYVQEGATGAGELYTCNTTGTITFGTTNITFAQISSAQIYSAGTGLTLTGTTFSVNNTQSQITTVGTLDSLSVTGNVTGGNLLTGGLVSLSSIVKTGTNGVGNIGASGSTFNTVFAKATSAQYADLAERYRADADYAPGTVLIIGGTHEVTASALSHDHRAAGVVSENPSYLMNAALDTVNSVAVALLGRVPCQVVGPINQGDLLTTSTIPGTACRLDPAKYLPGCVIGKALQDYHSEQPGTIEIAVGVK